MKPADIRWSSSRAAWRVEIPGKQKRVVSAEGTSGDVAHRMMAAGAGAVCFTADIAFAMAVRARLLPGTPQFLQRDGDSYIMIEHPSAKRGVIIQVVGGCDPKDTVQQISEKIQQGTSVVVRADAGYLRQVMALMEAHHDGQK
jgi:hypothetical protein